jgi:hypothetical protein
MSAVNGVLAVADILKWFQHCWHPFTGIPAVVVCSDVPATSPAAGVPSVSPAVSQVLDVVEFVIVIICLLLLVVPCVTNFVGNPSVANLQNVLLHNSKGRLKT